MSALPSDDEVRVAATNLIASLDPNALNPEQFIAWSDLQQAIAAWNRRAPVGDGIAYETDAQVAAVRKMLELGVDMQGDKATMDRLVSDILRALLAHIDEQDANLKCAIAVGRYAATTATPSIPSQENVARVIRGVYGVGEGTFRGGWQDKSIEEAAAAILALMGQSGDGWRDIASAQGRSTRRATLKEPRP